MDEIYNDDNSSHLGTLYSSTARCFTFIHQSALQPFEEVLRPCFMDKKYSDQTLFAWDRKVSGDWTLSANLRKLMVDPLPGNQRRNVTSQGTKSGTYVQDCLMPIPVSFQLYHTA